MAIRIPTNYDAVADIIVDLDDMADSIQDELDLKVDKVQGKGLSTEDYTTVEKNKLAGIEAQANKTVVDSSLSSSSTNPVQNKKVYEALAEKQEQIDALVEENSTLKKQQLKGQASGSSIQLTDSAEGLEIENVVIKGAIGQETRVGYNKIPYPYSNSTGKTSNGITFEVANGKISVNGTSTARNATFYLANNWNYVLSQAVTLCCTNLIDITKIQVAVSYYREGESNLTYTSFRNNPILLSSGSRIDTIYVQVSDSNVTVNETGIEIMMLEGDYTSSTIPEYEQYGATPSPEYESSINCVTGTNIVKVQNSDASLQQNAPLSLGNIKLYDGDKIQISFINKAGYKKVTGASITRKYLEYSFTGNENMRLDTAGEIPRIYVSPIVFGKGLKTTGSTNYLANIFCNYLPKVSAGQTYFGTVNIGIAVDTNGGLNIINYQCTSLEDYQQWLSGVYNDGHPLYFVGEMDELVTTSITDPTLLSQLETLINLKTHKQITNIETTGSDLAPVLEFQYSKDLQTVIDTMNARLELVEN